MAKNSISDWDETASNNTDIGGISITGASNVANFDNGLRELMSQIKTDLGNVDNTSDADKPINADVQTALDGKASIAHAHNAVDIIGLDAALDVVLESTALNPFLITNDSAVELFEITTEGYVLKPKNPAFHVSCGSFLLGTSGQKHLGIMNGSPSVYANNGSHYDSSNGRFTAPYDGLYEFFTTACTDSGSSHNVQIKFQKNGSQVGLTQLNYYNAYLSFSSKITVSLLEGDYITGTAESANGATSKLYTSSFDGKLIG